MADRTDAVLLGIAHWNKATGTDVAARITGSAAFKNVPRSIFGFIRDHESEAGECVMQQAKNSLGRYDLPSLRYRIDSATGIADTGKFVLCGESDRTVSQILAAKKPSDDPGDTDEDGSRHRTSGSGTARKGNTTLIIHEALAPNAGDLRRAAEFVAAWTLYDLDAMALVTKEG